MSRITSPEVFFGHQLGADRKIARWDKIVEYFNLLAKESDRIQVIDLGPSTEGHPFLLTVISSPENLANLEELRQINLQICDPRGLNEDAVKELTKRGKAVILQSMSLHATEIGGTQMAPELAYDLLSCDSEDTLRILENVIFLMVPCFNPDGQLMVTDWYNQWVGTEYEGAGLPYLYHKYAGHDNNRDAFAQNLIESQYMGRLLFREWKPQAFQDHHHMGSYGPRLYVSPYSEPIRPDADPLVWRELSWYGAHMAYKLEEAGKRGIANGVQFPGWGHYGFHWITNHHNIAGMLTESASAKLASPLYIQPDQLRGAGSTLPEYAAQTNFPHPWEGGWWRLRDIVEQQKISAWALLDVAARNKETVLWNAYQKAMRQTERGAAGKVKAYVIAPEQHDPLTARKLVQVLLNQGIEVQQASEQFVVDGCVYPEGTYLVSLAQPKMGVIKQLLGRTIFPDNPWTRQADGSLSVFDTATDTVAEFMGVKVLPLEKQVCGKFEVIDELPALSGKVCTNASYGYLVDGRLNDSYRAINRLLQQGFEVQRLAEDVTMDDPCWDDGFVPAGTYYLPQADREQLLPLAKELGLKFYGVKEPLTVQLYPVKQLRIGLYQRYYGGNADEGWTRLVLENFEFPYSTVMDAEIKAGNLNEKYDVLVFPSDFKQLIVDISRPDRSNPRAARFARFLGGSVPPEYRSGIGQEGVKAIRQFVEAGGRLVAMNMAVDFAIDVCDLQVQNVVAGLSGKEYYTHGSTLRTEVDNQHRLGLGMPQEALVLNFTSPVLQVTDMRNAEKYHVVVRYAQSDVLQSGALIGEKLIASKAAMLTAECGKGEIVLIAAPPQYRGQTHGTFKLLFNCLQ
ncbi:MAG: M14 family metallopeptidase [Bacillota bacterium]